MVLIIITLLNIVIILGQSWEHSIETRNIKTDCLYDICRKGRYKLPALVLFCQHVYEKVFTCPSKLIPHRFVCDGQQHCQNGVDEDPAICDLLYTKEICKRDNMYSIDVSLNCGNKVDAVSQFCNNVTNKSQIYCPVVFKENHIVTCYRRYNKIPVVISCYGHLPPGTIVEVRCGTFYISKTSHQILECQNNGAWNQKMLECKPVCGVSDEEQFFPLILNGWSIKPTLWPWYAALFTIRNKKWHFFCSSTIISKNMVITAAHCIWNISKENVKVVAGKFLSNFYAAEANSQISDIQEFIFHPLYQDSLGNYESDIAIIILNMPFFLSKEVLPICLNMSLRDILQEPDDILEGMVIGMGMTENASISANLRATTVHIINNTECVDNQRYEFRKYVTISSFCAGQPNRSGVCNGDSGSGLARKSKVLGKWILEGIVSISPKNPKSPVCNVTQYSIFTNVGMYANWIYRYLSRYSIN